MLATMPQPQPRLYALPAQSQRQSTRPQAPACPRCSTCTSRHAPQARELIVQNLPVSDDVMMRMLEALVQVGATAKQRRQLVRRPAGRLGWRQPSRTLLAGLRHGPWPD